jgi:nucleoid DNA-binding protein
MNTTELAYEIARRSKQGRDRLTREQAALALDLLLQVMGDELAQPEGKVTLRNFATITVEQGVLRGGALRNGVQRAGERYYRLRFRVSRAHKGRLQALQPDTALEWE